MPDKPDKVFNSLIKKLKEIEVKPKTLSEDEDSVLEEYQIPLDVFDKLDKQHKQALWCWLNKDEIAQA